MEVSGQLHAPAALPLGKEPLVRIRKEAGHGGDIHGRIILKLSLEKLGVKSVEQIHVA
jgi:hypothetical protein